MAGEEFTCKLYIRQSGSPYNAYGLFTKYCERIKKFKETDNLHNIYKTN